MFLASLRRLGLAGVRAQMEARREYAALFPGETLRADQFAPVDLLVRQVHNQPRAPKISVIVPMYNPPLEFLQQLLDSVRNQTYQELGALPGGCGHR